MIAVDTNVLVHAHRQDSPFHASAKRSVALLAEGASMWAIPWPCVHETYSVITHPKIYAPPTPHDRAMRQIEAWIEVPTLVLLAEGPGYWECLSRLLRESPVQGPQIHDARIAALCLSHGVSELWTADRDFERFPELRTHNPLGEPA